MNYPTLLQKHQELQKMLDAVRANRIILANQVLELEKNTSNYDGKTYTVNEMKALVDKMVKQRYGKVLDTKTHEIAMGLLPVKVGERLDHYYESYPSGCPEKLVDLVNKLADEKVDLILKNKEYWPPWFSLKYTNLVDRMVQADLDDKFYDGVEKAARERLEVLKRGEWPRYWDRYILPNIGNVVAEIVEGKIVNAGCPKCGTVIPVQFSLDGATQLIRKGWVQVSCTNIGCNKKFRYYLQEAFNELFPVEQDNPIEYRATIVNEEDPTDI